MQVRKRIRKLAPREEPDKGRGAFRVDWGRCLSREYPLDGHSYRSVWELPDAVEYIEHNDQLGMATVWYRALGRTRVQIPVKCTVSVMRAGQVVHSRHTEFNAIVEPP